MNYKVIVVLFYSTAYSVDATPGITIYNLTESPVHSQPGPGAARLQNVRPDNLNHQR